MQRGLQSARLTIDRQLRARHGHRLTVDTTALVLNSPGLRASNQLVFVWRKVEFVPICARRRPPVPGSAHTGSGDQRERVWVKQPRKIHTRWEHALNDRSRAGLSVRLQSSSCTPLSTPSRANIQTRQTTQPGRRCRWLNSRMWAAAPSILLTGAELPGS